jgi:hypothetical protein
LGTEYSPEVAPLLTGAYGEAYDKEKSRWESLAKTVWRTDDYAEGGSNAISKIIDEYQKVTKQDLMISSNAVRKENGEYRVYHINDKGEDVVLGTLEELIETIATTKATDSLEDENVKIVNKLNKTLEKGGTTIRDMFNSFTTRGSFGDDLTQADIDNLKNLSK